jgi:hypothetical protein
MGFGVSMKTMVAMTSVLLLTTLNLVAVPTLAAGDCDQTVEVQCGSQGNSCGVWVELFSQVCLPPDYSDGQDCDTLVEVGCSMGDGLICYVWVVVCIYSGPN